MISRTLPGSPCGKVVVHVLFSRAPLQIIYMGVMLIEILMVDIAKPQRIGDEAGRHHAMHRRGPEDPLMAQIKVGIPRNTRTESSPFATAQTINLTVRPYTVATVAKKRIDARLFIHNEIDSIQHVYKATFFTLDSTHGTPPWLLYGKPVDKNCQLRT